MKLVLFDDNLLGVISEGLETRLKSPAVTGWRGG